MLNFTLLFILLGLALEHALYVYTSSRDTNIIAKYVSTKVVFMITSEIFLKNLRLHALCLESLSQTCVVVVDRRDG